LHESTGIQNIPKDLTWIRQKIIKNGAMKNWLLIRRVLVILVVELGDMTAITEKEKGKIGELVELANMCVYTAGSAELGMDSLLALGRQLGVSETDKTQASLQL